MNAFDESKELLAYGVLVGAANVMNSTAQHSAAQIGSQKMHSS